jgi:hypothetical protein
MTYGAPSPDDPSHRLQPHLRPGEHLVWVGTPDLGVTFTAADAFLVPFSIMWGGFTIFWEAEALTSGAPPFFLLWGIPFVGVGVYFIFGRFIYKRHRKRQTAYGLTLQRAMVAVGSTSLVDSPVKNVSTSIRKSRDGRHVSVTFGESNYRDWRQGGYYANTGMEFFARGVSPVAFFDVADPDRLLSALDKIRTE